MACASAVRLEQLQFAFVFVYLRVPCHHRCSTRAMASYAAVVTYAKVVVCVETLSAAD